MADSTALRVRRSRAHKAGDHSLCRRCPEARGEAPRPITALPSAAPAPHLDAGAEMRNLALRLIAAHEADPPNTLLARELRLTLAELMPKAGNADADLAGLFSALQA